MYIIPKIQTVQVIDTLTEVHKTAERNIAKKFITRARKNPADIVIKDIAVFYGLTEADVVSILKQQNLSISLVCERCGAQKRTYFGFTCFSCAHKERVNRLFPNHKTWHDSCTDCGKPKYKSPSPRCHACANKVIREKRYGKKEAVIMPTNRKLRSYADYVKESQNRPAIKRTSSWFD